MSRSGANNQAGSTQRCIVALLFGLALLAEGAALLPAPLRITVLNILRSGERVAHSYVYWRLRECGLSLQWGLPDDLRDGYDPEAAMALGWWFRILAIILRDLPRRAMVEKRRRKFPESAARRSLSLAGRVDSRRLAGCGSLSQRGPPFLSI